jgi:pyruvate/2-oxoglutarate/acetoin dehydrogenase E1 component
MAELTYLEAIRSALLEEMQRDPRVFVIGEDVGAYGGAFRVTQGFLETFGPSRVIDTPISESAIVGASIGAALFGQRPVAERDHHVAAVQAVAPYMRGNAQMIASGMNWATGVIGITRFSTPRQPSSRDTGTSPRLRSSAPNRIARIAADTGL